MNQIKPRKGYKIIKGLFGKYEEIPEEWEVTRHGYVCEFINGYAYSEKEFSDKGYQIIRIQNLTGGTNFVHSNIKLPEKQFVVDGDLLFAWSATFSPFIWHGKKSAFHYHQWKIIPNELSDKMFLFYHFKQKTPLIKNMGQSGLGMFHITKHAMEQFLFLKPPLSEQQKIASILSNVDTLIENTQKIIDTTIKLKKGLMQKLFTQGIGHTKFRKVKSLFGKYEEIPEEWKIEALKYNAIISAGGTPSREKHDYWYNGTIPWLSSGEVNNNIISSSKEKITKIGLENSSARIFPKGCVLLAITGQGRTRGRTGLLKINSSTNQSVVGIELGKKIYNMYLWYYLQNQYEKLRNISQGSNQGGLNLKIINDYKILIPLIVEQQKIASILSNIDSLIQSQRNNKEKLEHLKKSLMQKLLTGKVRVKI